MNYLGVDVGGTNLVAGVIDENGNIIAKKSTKTLSERPYQEVIKDIGELLLAVIDEAGLKVEDFDKVGVGMPGVSDNEKGEVVFSNNIDWHNVPFVKELQKTIDLDVVLENDANVLTLSEVKFGAAKGCKNAVMMTLGTGLGGGILMDGKMRSGSHNVGAEIGHMVIVVDGIECTCGFRGCLERYASATALINQGIEAAKDTPESEIYKAVDGDMSKMNAKIIVDAAKNGDETAIKVFDKYIYYLSVGILSMINILDPEIFVIGGGVSKAGDFLLSKLRNQVSKIIFYKELPYARIELAKLSADAGLIGAACLVM